MSQYMILLLFVISIPFLYSFEKRVQYYKSWDALFKAIILTMIPFIIWDILFTYHGIWHFNETYTGNLTLAGLPLEEWLFFVAVPFSCIYIYAWVKYFRRDSNDIFSDTMSHFFLFSGVILLVTAFIFYKRSYTLVTFGALGFIFLLVSWQRPPYIKSFFIAFLITMVPFFIVNGYLTAKPVVIYDDQENLGIRIFTIPFEDGFYSMTLLLVNTIFYEKFLDNRKTTV